MSFDKETRNLLAKTVAACRCRLTEDVTDQLRGVFGLHPDGTMLPLDKLTHLSLDQVAAARRLRDLLDHYIAGAAGKESVRRKAAYERMVLEISFTILNRLAALRLCEERGLVVECVHKGTSSDGFRLFERISGGALGGRYDTYRVFLKCFFDELALDLGVLFDRTTPQSAVFPSERCMEDVLAELNKTELTHLWTEDETIGWVYQYFNPPEERKAMREASQAPRNSRELAVRNQFFTPRYVVEFLTDNTLGRIWYEMRKGDTELREECLYLVRRPNEVFLGPGEKAPAGWDDETDLSQEELFKRPVYIEHRPKKDPRDLRILDPACGSGHFLLYAFDLLERIYEEAWGDPGSSKSKATGRTIQEDFETINDLRREVPKLIVEYNLHGIDIDPRAVQIAALALWLRAQKAWKNLGLKAPERPRIAKSNIVTAEPMPGEEDMRREFTAGLKPRVLGQIVDEVFEKMKIAGEAGSLLKIEEEIKDAVAAAGKQWREAPKPEQQLLFPAMDATRPKQQELRFDVKGVTDERFWDQAEDRILDALKDYAEQAENGRAVRRRLFAEDASRGFAFIDLCRKSYDTVLMNPPFGLATKDAFEYLEQRMPQTYVELYASFVERGLSVSGSGGLVGAISSRGFVTMSRLEEWRRQSLLPRLSVLLDLGLGVMDDAFVEACAYVVGQSDRTAHLIAIDLRNEEDKQGSWHNKGLLERALGAGKKCVFTVSQDRLLQLPQAKVLYSIDTRVSDLLSQAQKFEPTSGVVRTGLTTFDDFRFLRLLWEPPADAIGKRMHWEFFSKGGEYAKYYTDVHLLVNRHNNGEELAETNRRLNGQTAQSQQGSKYYYRPGLTFTSRSAKGFTVRVLPCDCIISHNAPSIYGNDTGSLPFLLAWLNSRPIRTLVELQANAAYFTPGTIKNLPWVPPNRDQYQAIQRAGRSLIECYARFSELDETSSLFSAMSADMLRHDFFDRYKDTAQALTATIKNLQHDVSEKIDSLYGFDTSTLGPDVLGMDADKDVPKGTFTLEEITAICMSYVFGCIIGRWDIRIAINASLAPKLPDPFDPLPVCPPGMLVGSDGLPAEPNRIVSEEWLRARPDANTLPPEGSVKNPTIPDAEYPIRISWDGVLVDDPGFNGNQPHRDDIVRRVREVFDLLWKDKAHEIEQEACDILGVSDLRDYFRKPTGFFQDHLKRYSKSRRKAPIYWPLSTASGSYTVWLYYHRLTDQTLYAAVNKYVEPKIAEVERGIARIQEEHKSVSGREATRLTDCLNEARSFLGELLGLREELLRIAALPYKPDLNDGVIINAAPFHNLFRLRPWAGDTEDCWEKLCKGDFDWAHLAYTIWPDRVREACRKDRSIAIAHGLDDICEFEDAAPKRKGVRGRRIKEAAL